MPDDCYMHEALSNIEQQGNSLYKCMQQLSIIEIFRAKVNLLCFFKMKNISDVVCF